MPLFVELTRSGRVESSHTIHVAVVDPTGALVARSGDVDRFAYWRSSAKPFQALPLVEDGGADRFGFGDEELALCCASHSSEPEHLQGVRRMLERIGCTEDDLACGGHPPLSAAVAAQLARSGDEPSPVWSNCSGKHAGMLAQAKHHGWATRGYELASHPVQQRIISVVSKYTDLAPEALHLGVDGCTAACFGLSLRAMAVAYARLGASQAPAEQRIKQAMWAFPHRIAGRGRLCTALMETLPGRVLAKVGAEGVYGACVPELGLGIALKVEDGDMTSSPAALLAVLHEVAEPLREGLQAQALASYREAPLHNTRGAQVGVRRASGQLER